MHIPSQVARNILQYADMRVKRANRNHLIEGSILRVIL
jgi:hypothetical protein